MTRSVGPEGTLVGSNRLTGGLDTNRQPTRMPHGTSPDLENVSISGDAVEKRGGFTPYFKEHMPMSCVRNVGFRRATRVGTGDVEAYSVPGALYAGDRQHFEATSLEVMLDFFVRPDDLSTETLRASSGNPANSFDEFSNVTSGGSSDKSQILIRPIISKGPVKKVVESNRQQALAEFSDENGTYVGGNEADVIDGTGAAGAHCVTPGQIQWEQTNAFGPGGEILDCAIDEWQNDLLGTGGVQRAILRSRHPHGLSAGDWVEFTGHGNGTNGLFDGVHQVVSVSGDRFDVNFGSALPAAGVNKVSVRKVPTVLGHACPWFVFLQNDGTVTDPQWRFKFFGQYRANTTATVTSGEFRSFTSTNTIDVEEGAVYHVIASINYAAGTVRFRVGKWNSVLRSFSYVQANTTLQGTSPAAPINPPHPVQIFDCPQMVIEAPVAQPVDIWPIDGGTPTFRSMPPGLGRTTSSASGGYFNCVRRLEGAIEDVLIWRSSLASDDDDSYDRSSRLQRRLVDTDLILNYWPMSGPNDRMAEEKSGRTNHLYFTPDFPILDTYSGGVRSDNPNSWWFNGRTSYAIADMDRSKCWSMLSDWDDNASIDTGVGLSPREAFVQRIIKTRSGIGIHIEFMADSIEPYEQVLAEISGVMRCVIRPDGRLGLYFRDKQEVQSNVNEYFYTAYDGACSSRTVIRTGRRYNVTFAVNSTAFGAYIAFNGVVDRENLNDADHNIGQAFELSHPIGAFTIGIGSRHFVADSERSPQAVSNVGTISGLDQNRASEAGIGDAWRDSDNKERDKLGRWFRDPQRVKRVALEDAGSYVGSTFTPDAIIESQDTGTNASGTKPFPSGASLSGTADPIYNDGNGGLTPNRVCTDFRSAFCGRIEVVKLLVGRGLEEVTSIKDEGVEDWSYETVPLFKVPSEEYTNTTGWTTNRETSVGLAETGWKKRDSINEVDTFADPPGLSPGSGIQIAGSDTLYHVQDQNVDAADKLQPSFAHAGQGDGQLDVPLVKVGIYHVVGCWYLNDSYEDDFVDTGRYRNNVEWRRQRWKDGTNDFFNLKQDDLKYVAQQQTPVFDQLGFMGPMIARCTEVDTLTEAENIENSGGNWRYDAPDNSGNSSMRSNTSLPGKVFQEFVPREIGPRWTEGLVRGGLEDVRVSLIADWNHTISDERFIITSSARNLYWAKSIWRDDSPFTDETNSVWMFGQNGEHITAPCSSLRQVIYADGSEWSPQTVELWCRPIRLDGWRMLASVRLIETGEINYMVGTWNGNLFVCGTLNGSTESWFYFSGSSRDIDPSGFSQGPNKDRVGDCELQLNRWNHIHVVLGRDTSNPVVAYINGNPTILTSLAAGSLVDGFTGTPLTSPSTDTPDAQPSEESSPRLYLGGMPRGFRKVRLPTTASPSVNPMEFTVESWCGMLTEFRSRGAVDPNYPAVTATFNNGAVIVPPGPIPSSRYSEDSSPGGYLLHLSEGSGWVFPNDVEGVESDAAISQIKEMILIAENIGDSYDDPYSWVVFRDRLYFTNGVGRPKEVIFDRFTSPDGPFRVQNMGMLQGRMLQAPTYPLDVESKNIRIEPTTSTSPSTQLAGMNNKLPALDGAIVPITSQDPPEVYRSGNYQFWMTFVDSDNRESEPTFLGSYEIGGSGANVAFDEVNATPTIESGVNNFSVAGGEGEDVRFELSLTITPTSQSDLSATNNVFNDTPMLVRVVTQAAGGDIPIGWYIGRFVYNEQGASGGPYAYIYLPGTASAGAMSRSTGGRIEVWHSAWRIVGFPRSTDPQCVARRFYTSASGGGPPIAHTTLRDNVSDSIELIGNPVGVDGSIALEIGRKVVPPRAKLIAAGSGSLFLANLTRVPAGQGAFAQGDPEVPTYFPVGQQAVLDSEDGKSITGLGSHLGRFFMSKRDSIWGYTSGQAVGQGVSFLRPINHSIGVGGGMVRYDNLMIGSGERGIYGFDGSSVRFMSNALENEWGRIAIQDRDLIRQFGVFYRDRSQFWISVRDQSFQSSRANNRIYVLHTDEMSEDGRLPWTRFLVPNHTYMEEVVDPVTQRPEVLLGTDDGRILIYNESVFVDGSDDAPGPSQIAGNITTARLTSSRVASSPAISSTGVYTITEVDTLDVVQDGLRGIQAIVLAQYPGIPSLITWLPRVVSNTATTIQFDQSFEIGGVAPISAYVILGAYDSYWSSPWMSFPEGGGFSVLIRIDAEFAPTDGKAVIQWEGAINPADGSVHKPIRAIQASYGATNGESGDNHTAFLDLTNGYQIQPAHPRKRNAGRYTRMVFGTRPLYVRLNPTTFVLEEALSIRNPWQLFGLTGRLQERGTRGSGPQSR